MPVKKLFPFFLILLVLFEACSSSQPPVKKSNLYPSSYKLTDEIAYSSASDLEINIPKGWFTAEDTICKCIDIWLIRDDFSATLNFFPLDIDTSLALNFRQNLAQLIDLSKTSKQKGTKELVLNRPDDYFEINGSLFGAYEFIGDENLPIRVTLFNYKNKVYELSAMPASETGRGKVNPEELFTIQNSILASIHY